MNTLTKEWLQNTITSIESARDEIPFGLDEDQNNMLTALKIALASLAAVSDERAAYELFMEKRFGESVDRRRAKNGDREYMAWDMALGWIIWCHRAAMLQGSQPVSQTYKLPVNTPCQDAPAHIWLQTAGVWPEDGELSELTWCSHNQHHDDTLYVRADLVNGNSPVTPDGWVMVPKELTPEMMRAVQIRSELGGYATSNLSGAYNMFSEFWNVAVSAAPKMDDL